MKSPADFVRQFRHLQHELELIGNCYDSVIKYVASSPVYQKCKNEDFSKIEDKEECQMLRKSRRRKEVSISEERLGQPEKKMKVEKKRDRKSKIGYVEDFDATIFIGDETKME